MLLFVLLIPNCVDSGLPMCHSADQCSDTGRSLVSLAGIGARAYLPPMASNTLASTLPTRFPAALDIGHGPACGLANACALVYVAA